MFIPREGDTAASLEEETPKIDLQGTEFKTGTFELTPKPTDYEKLLTYAGECAQAGDHLFLGKNWKTKEDCLILGTSNIPDRLKCIQDRGIKVEIKEVEARPFMLTHEFISEKSEFEAIADAAVDCAKEPDKLLLGEESLLRKNCILFLTYDATAASNCLGEKNFRIQIEPT